jgi:hypothetical protein
VCATCKRTRHGQKDGVVDRTCSLLNFSMAYTYAHRDELIFSGHNFEVSPDVFYLAHAPGVYCRMCQALRQASDVEGTGASVGRCRGLPLGGCGGHYTECQRRQALRVERRRAGGLVEHEGEE